MKWLLIIPGVLVGFLILFAILVTAPVLISIPFVLLFGWVPAAKRLAVAMPFSALELVVFGAGCLALLLGAHWFVRHLGTWKLRWSVALTGAVALVLLSIMCMVGTAHQAGWILLSSEPLLVNRGSRWRGEHIDLLNTANAVAKLAPADLEKLSDAATLLRDGRLPDTHDRKRPWEKYQIFSTGESGEPRVAIWPRDQRIHTQLGTAVIDAQGNVSLQQTNYRRSAQSNDAKSY